MFYVPICSVLYKISPTMFSLENPSTFGIFLIYVLPYRIKTMLFQYLGGKKNVYEISLSLSLCVCVCVMCVCCWAKKRLQEQPLYIHSLVGNGSRRNFRRRSGYKRNEDCRLGMVPERERYYIFFP